MDDFWKDAEVIVSYTRAQAIADGVLRDAGALAQEAGFRVPVALSAAAWAEAVTWSEENGGLQDETGRLWDVLNMARYGIQRAKGRHAESGPRLAFTLYRVPNVPDATEANEIVLELHIGPGDSGEPVITIGLPGED